MWASRYLQRNPLRFVGVTVLVLAGALLAVMFVTEDGGRTLIGPPLGVDFTGFYAAGVVLNEHPSAQLYDFTRHDHTLHAVFPQLPPADMLPFVQPPYFSILFEPLARLGYRPAFALWLLASIALLLSGLKLISKACPAIPRADWSTILLLALSFEPLVFECWIGGQASTLGLFCLAAALHLERRGRPVGSGLALAACLYKPTLLVLVVPMLLISRRWRTLLGLLAGAAALVGVSLWAYGVAGCQAYLRLAQDFAQGVADGTTALPAGKFVDLTSMQRVLFAGGARWAPLVTLGLALAALPVMTRVWWRLRKDRDVGGNMGWAFTLTASLVLNVYVGVYDTTIVLVGALLTVDALARSAPGHPLVLPRAFKALLVLLYLTPWVTPPLARSVGVQPYTLVLALLAAYQLTLASRLAASTPAATPAATPASSGLSPR